ncbi:MAG: hypothetical protein GQ549_07755, partial [Gammaproteobacteria bacterium]|nr:hypothetical protein [Gammaproteobacteria bacterium]
SAGALSLIPFKKLLSSEHTIAAVGIYKPLVFNSKIIALENESLALAARQKNIPVIDLSLAVDDVLQQCSKYTVDVTLMSCYSKRLADEIINFSPLGCYNMHPSLLPRYRGPEPVFWQMQQGADMGVSWHKVIADFDAGDIVGSKAVLLDDGDEYQAISLQLANAGANLLSALLAELSGDKVTAIAQEAALASYYPYPQEKDFMLDTRRSAQQLYNFMCATQIFSQPYRCDVGKTRFNLVRALDYDNNAELDVVEVQADKLFIPCSEGVLIASYTDKIPL